jgi:hypothetical protein
VAGSGGYDGTVIKPAVAMNGMMARYDERRLLTIRTMSSAPSISSATDS